MSEGEFIKMESINQEDIKNLKDEYDCLISSLMMKLKGNNLLEGLEILRNFKDKESSNSKFEFELYDSDRVKGFNNAPTGKSHEKGIELTKLYYRRKNKYNLWNAAIGSVTSSKDEDYCEWESYPYQG